MVIISESHIRWIYLSFKIQANEKIKVVATDQFIVYVNDVGTLVSDCQLFRKLHCSSPTGYHCSACHFGHSLFYENVFSVFTKELASMGHSGSCIREN